MSDLSPLCEQADWREVGGGHRQSKQAQCSAGVGPVVPCLRHNPRPVVAFGRSNLKTPNPDQWMRLKH